MARIDYFSIQTELQRILRADPNLDGLTVTVEEDGPRSAEFTPWIGIYLIRAPLETEYIAAGTRITRRIVYQLWFFGYHLEHIYLAAQVRDDILGKAEIALMTSRRTNNTLKTMLMSAIEFEPAISQAGFMMGASMDLEFLVDAQT